MFNFVITLKKSILGFLTGLAAVVVLAIVQAISNYSPIVCSDVVTDNCTPQIVVTAYSAIIPTVSALLVGLANWLKNRNK